MTFSNAGALKQADSAVQLKGGSVVRMDQDSQYAYVMQHVTKLCGAPADSIQLFWCNAWRKRTLIRPTNSTFPHTVRGAPSTLKSMILNLADTGKPFTLEYEVSEAALTESGLRRLCVHCAVTLTGTQLQNPTKIAVHMATSCSAGQLLQMVLRSAGLAYRDNTMSRVFVTTTHNSFSQLQLLRLEDPLPELTSDSHVYIQPPAPLLADAPGGEAIVVWHYDITSLAVVQFGHPFVVSLQAGETVKQLKHRIKAGLVVSDFEFASWTLCWLRSDNAAMQQVDTVLQFTDVLSEKHAELLAELSLQPGALSLGLRHSATKGGGGLQTAVKILAK